jgi:hypothetical protein
MTRPLRLAVVSLALFASPLFTGLASVAPGIALAWDHCLAQGTGVQNKMFACDTNAGSNLLVGTFELTRPMPGVTAGEVILQVAAASATLPEWWQFHNAGSCRLTALSADALADPADVACPSWSPGNLFVFLAAYCPQGGLCIDSPNVPNQARIKIVEAVTQQNATDLLGAQPYFAFNMTISNQTTVGTGACAGCEIPVCIVLNSINVIAGTVENRFISNAAAPGANFVTWQGGGPGCPGATPTRNATWGAVKSMYR